MRKLVLALLVAVLLTPAVAVEFPDEDVFKGEKPLLQVECSPSEDCPTSDDITTNVKWQHELYICGKKFDGTTGQTESDGSKVFKFRSSMPDSCSLGNDYEVTVSWSDAVTQRSDSTGGSVRYNGRISGKFLNVKLNTDTEPATVHQFHFTDDWTHEDDLFNGRPSAYYLDEDDTGKLMISEDRGKNVVGTDAWANFDVETGVRMEASDGTNLNQFIDSPVDNVCEGDCGPRTFSVMNEPFDIDHPDQCGGDWSSPGDTCYLVQKDESDDPPVDYMPRGDIITAYLVSSSVSDRLIIGDSTERELRFFACDPDRPEVDGKTVYVGGQAYACDLEGGPEDWRYINDPGGKDDPDLADWDPIVPTDDDEAPTCEPFIGQDSEGDKTAYYNSGDGSASPLDNSCNYETEPVSNIPTGTPDTFECDSSGNSDESDGNKERFCNYLVDQGVDYHFLGHDGTVEAVEYYVPGDAIPYSEEAEQQGVRTGLIDDSKADEFVRNSDDPTPNTPRKQCGEFDGGFITARCETLHMAEREYVGGAYGHHLAATWRDRNMTDLQGYEDGNPDQYSEAWVVSNASQTNDNVLSSPENGIIAQSTVFNGGFAGECSTGQIWAYDDGDEQWECSGDIPWDFKYLVPDLDNEGSQATVGVFLDNRIFRTADPGSSRELQEQSLTWSWSQAKDPGITLQDIEARCYAGSEGYERVSQSQRFPDTGWRQVSIPSDGFGQSLIGITGEIRVGEESEYTCEWRINAEKGNGDPVVFREAGTGSEIAPGQLADYGSVSGFEVESVCPDEAGDGKVVCSESVRLSTSPGSGKEMEEFASAVSVN